MTPQNYDLQAIKDRISSTRKAISKDFLLYLQMIFAFIAILMLTFGQKKQFGWISNDFLSFVLPYLLWLMTLFILYMMISKIIKLDKEISKLKKHIGEESAFVSYFVEVFQAVVVLTTSIIIQVKLSELLDFL